MRELALGGCFARTEDYLLTAHGARTVRAAVRPLVVLIIVSIVLAAVAGILALDDGDIATAWEVQAIATPLVAAVVGIATLCFLATAGTRYWGIGVFGGLVTGLTAAYTLLFFWSEEFRDYESETMVRAHGVGIILTVALSQIALLLGVAGDRPRLRIVVWPIVALSVAATALAGSLAVNDAPMTDTEYQALLALTFFNGLGTLLTLALALFGPRSPANEARVAGPLPRNA